MAAARSWASTSFTAKARHVLAHSPVVSSLFSQRSIPRSSRTRSPEAPDRGLQFPQHQERKALVTAGIPGYSRSARKRHDRPVTPEVGGSSPVASVSQNACKSNSFVVCLGANSCSRFGRLLPAYLLAVEISTRSSCKSHIRRALRR